MEIQTAFSLEWEYKALQETKKYLLKKWEKQKALHSTLHKENKQIFEFFTKNNIKLVDLHFNFEFPDKEHLALYRKIFYEIIFFDPYLVRILFHTLVLPEYLCARVWLMAHHISEKLTYNLHYDFNDLDVLENSELTKHFLYQGNPIKCFPLRRFITGKILDFIFSEHEHYKMIDLVKTKGAKETIEELRKSRIYEINRGRVFDYTPISKTTIFNDTDCIVEFYDQESYEKVINQAPSVVDEVLCDLIQKPQPNPSQDIAFYDSRESCVTIKYKTEETVIKTQLLPKYRNLIRGVSKKYTLTNIKTDETGQDKEEERQESVFGLYEGAKTWNKTKGIHASWFKNNILWHLGDVFEQMSKDGVLKEEVESSGGSLDQPVSIEDEISKKDFIQDESETVPERVDFQDKLDRIKILIERDPRMQSIIQKEHAGTPLSTPERKYKERFIKKYKQE